MTGRRAPAGVLADSRVLWSNAPEIVENLNKRMKKQELEKRLRQKGACFVGHGGKHDRWESANGYPFTVPRHAEIPERMAREILKQADH